MQTAFHTCCFSFVCTFKLANLEKRAQTRMQKGTLENRHCISAAFSEIQWPTSTILSEEDCVMVMLSCRMTHKSEWITFHIVSSVEWSKGFCIKSNSTPEPGLLCFMSFGPVSFETVYSELHVSKKSVSKILSVTNYPWILFCNICRSRKWANRPSSTGWGGRVIKAMDC